MSSTLRMMGGGKEWIPNPKNVTLVYKNFLTMLQKSVHKEKDKHSQKKLAPVTDHLV